MITSPKKWKSNKSIAIAVNNPLIESGRVSAITLIGHLKILTG